MIEQDDAYVLEGKIQMDNSYVGGESTGGSVQQL